MRVLSVLFFVGICLFGCTLTEMNRQNEAAMNRIDTKTQVLREEQSEQGKLLARQKELLQEREDLQAAIAKINVDIATLEKEIARVKVENESQRKKKIEVEARLRKYREEIAKLNSDSPSPDEEKKRKVEDLQKQIDASLKTLRSL